MADLSSAKRIFAAIRAIPRGQVAGYGEVARRAGFADQSHLTRLLRRLSGLTPRLIRGT